jgi:hypothetical protein
MYAMSLLFHMLHVELLLSLFISILFVFIYIFLLNTFNKSVEKNKTKLEWTQVFTLANIVRAGFVVFVAFLMSKPIEIFFFRNRLDMKVAAHKAELLNNYQLKTDVLEKNDQDRINKEILFYELQVIKYSYAGLQDQLKTLKDQLALLKSRQERSILSARLRIEHSDFLLFRIIETNKNGIAWLICASIILLFLAPGFLIYSIPKEDAYFRLKNEMEKELISNEFNSFSERYTEIFRKTYNLDMVYFSKYLDPPFNTERKPGVNFQSQADFLKRYSD